MKIYLLILNLLYFFVEIDCWRIFQNHRRVVRNRCLECRKMFPVKWFRQQLDHFNPTDETTWQQRYYTNEQFFNPEVGGPVFLMIGDEGTISAEVMKDTNWGHYAEHFGALMFQVEHRYYGKSHPTKDLSTENLKYLTSQQALADLATFIATMNKKYNLPSDVKWIAFGGSYAGSLAAWLRSTYPHLVHGAISSSAPLLAKVDFPDYYKIVTEVIAAHSTDCLNAIKEGFDQISTLLKEKPEILNRIFNLCDPIQNSISNDLDISTFYMAIASIFAAVVQSYFKTDTVDPIDDIICNAMVNQTLGPPVNRLGRLYEFYFREPCLDYKYENGINAIRNVTLNTNERQWIYQTCTEFAFFQTSTYVSHIFGDTFQVNYYTNFCAKVFGDRYSADFLDRAVNRTNMIYGGLDIKVKNVAFVHGSYDPWQALGITKTTNPASPVIYIQGESHCADMFESYPFDSEELKKARQQIQDFIATLLKS